MGDGLFIFLIVLIVLAGLTRETFLVTLFYLFAGVFILGRWWSNQVVSRVMVQRKYDHQVFPDETITMNLKIKNQSFLPAVWLRVQDLYPIEVAEVKTFTQIISLGPRETTQLSYTLKPHKRGLYRIGPLLLSSGDLLGISSERQSESNIDRLVVYPRVIPFTKVTLPSHSPLGSLPHTQPIFEDPARLAGKRPYHPGDSIRRIDWKATAAAGSLQTKIFEPSIALESALFLNLDQEDYPLRSRVETTEFAITVCASLGNWIINQRQAAGLFTNGVDPWSQQNSPAPVPIKKGRAHLMRILELLARIRAQDQSSFVAYFRQQRIHLPWGTTVILITGFPDETLFDELLIAKRAGLNLFLILCGEYADFHQAVEKARFYAIPTVVLRDDRDLEIWRRGQNAASFS